jgi:hypothetical protein
VLGFALALDRDLGVAAGEECRLPLTSKASTCQNG